MSYVPSNVGTLYISSDISVVDTEVEFVITVTSLLSISSSTLELRTTTTVSVIPTSSLTGGTQPSGCLMFIEPVSPVSPSSK